MESKTTNDRQFKYVARREGSYFDFSRMGRRLSLYCIVLLDFPIVNHFGHIDGELVTQIHIESHRQTMNATLSRGWTTRAIRHIIGSMGCVIHMKTYNTNNVILG